MNKKLSMMLLTLLAIVLITTAHADTSLSQSNPVAQVIDSQWDSIDIEITVNDLQSRDIKTKGGTFTRLTLNGDAFSGEIGSPRLPVIRKMVEVPYGAEIHLDYTAADWNTIDLEYPLVPVQAPVPKLPGALEAAPFAMNTAIYARDTFLSEPMVRIADIDYMRGHRLAVLEIMPVGYNPARNQIRFSESFEIRLEMSGADRDLTQQMDYRYYNTAFEIMFKDKVLNHGAYRSRDYVFPPPAPVGYLILNIADYSAAMAPFVEWKTMEGFEVTIEEVPSGASTTDVKAIIQNAYDNWPNPPAYVLLNGDTNTLPAYTGESSGSADDLQYTELEGSGYYTPDVMLGRFPVRSTSDIENILVKTLQWEQTTMPDTDYFKDSVFLASSDHASMLEATHEWCWDNHIEPYDPANNVYHDVYERLGGGTQDFADNVNAGRSFVCYSGHGYGDGSGTASVHFVHSNVSALTNVDKYTHVMVFACGTNLHDQQISFGERWLLEANKGSVSYWGTSDSSYWDEDDYEQREIFRIQNEDSYYSLAAMYLAGLIEVHIQGGSSAYYFDIYNLMGDPSAIFHGRIPMTPTIAAAQSTTPNPQDFPVNVTDDLGPVQYALVSIYADGVLLGSAYTDVNGDALVHIEPAAPGDATITVTGRNLMTTQQDLMIMAAGCGVAVLESELYNCDQTIMVTLWDADLNINPGSVDTAEVDISSDSEPTPEIIVMTETGPDSGEFTGTIMTSDTQSGAGYLWVANGDIITLHYYDEDCDGSAVDVYDDATVDCIGPVISGVNVSNVTVESAMIDWTTDEASTTVLVWGDTMPPDNELAVPGMGLNHMVTMDGLTSCTQYFFYAKSEDAAGNIAIDDNGGAYYSFTTLELVIMLDADMDTDPGWTYENQWAWGVPQGNDGDPSSGNTGSNVVGYNLSGDYTNNMPETYCTTQSFDCGEASEVFLTYYEWLGVESSTWDHASLDVSGNGGSSWDRIWTHSGSSVSGGSWTYMEYDISAIAAGNPDVKIRWVMGTTDSSVTYCGWNVDDVMVSFTRECVAPTPTPNPCVNDGDVTLDGEVTAGDAQMAFLIALGSYSPSFEEECAADCNGDEEVTAGDAQAIFMTALGMGSCVDPLLGDSAGHATVQSFRKQVRGLHAQSDAIWTENVSGRTGDQVTVDVWIDNPVTAVDVFTMTLAYDRDVLALADVHVGGLDPDWIEFGWNEAENGVVTVAAYNSGVGYEISPGSFGTLIELTFNVYRDVTDTGVTLLSVRDDLSGFVLR